MYLFPIIYALPLLQATAAQTDSSDKSGGDFISVAVVVSANGAVPDQISSPSTAVITPYETLSSATATPTHTDRSPKTWDPVNPENATDSDPVSDAGIPASGPGSNTYTVQVGSPSQPAFFPNAVTANIGDTIEFIFRSFNHTLSSSSLEHPCQANGQFESGFRQFNPADLRTLRLSFTVNTLEPQWFFCRQLVPFSHCALGMVFAINPGDAMNQFQENVLRDMVAGNVQDRCSNASATAIGSGGASAWHATSTGPASNLAMPTAVSPAISPGIARSIMSAGPLSSGAVGRPAPIAIWRMLSAIVNLF